MQKVSGLNEKCYDPFNDLFLFTS